MTPGVDQRPQPQRRRGLSFDLDQRLTKPGHRFAEVGRLVGGLGLGQCSLRWSGLILAPPVFGEGLRQGALLRAPLILAEAGIGLGEGLVDFDQLFQAERALVDQLDIPYRLTQQAHCGVVFKGAELSQPSIETYPLLTVGSRHRVLHELDARKIPRELLRSGAAPAQKTDESEKPYRAGRVHCSMNRPELKSKLSRKGASGGRPAPSRSAPPVARPGSSAPGVPSGPSPLESPVAPSVPPHA